MQMSIVSRVIFYCLAQHCQCSRDCWIHSRHAQLTSRCSAWRMVHINIKSTFTCVQSVCTYIQTYIYS